MQVQGADSSPCKGTYKELVECRDRVEQEIISKYPTLLERNGDKLTLKPTHKFAKPKVLKNNHSTYTVIAHYPEQQITLIRFYAHEVFNAFIYHHLHGQYQEVFNDIIFSDDNQYMLAFGADLEAGFSPNAISVFRLNSWPEIMSSFHTQRFGVVEAKFLSNDAIQLKTIFFESGGLNGYGYGECSLIRNNDIWQFKDFTCEKLKKNITHLNLLQSNKYLQLF